MAFEGTSGWSRSLQQQTRLGLELAPVTPDGRLHFKHPTKGYAYLKLEELNDTHIVLYTKPEGEQLRFDDTDALLAAGWALD